MKISFSSITIRSIFKNLMVSFINLSGLSIGIATVILIGLFVNNELSTDHFLKDNDRIYCVSVDGGKSGWSPAALEQIIKEKVPGVEQYTKVQFWEMNNRTFRYENDRPIRIDNIIRADPSFFDIFNYPFVDGNPQTALNEPNGLVLTQSMATTIFGNKNPIGKTLSLNKNKLLLKVTGVIKDLPPNTALKFNGAMSSLSINTLYPYSLDINGMEAFNFETFVKIQPNVVPADVEKNLTAALKSSLPTKWADRTQGGSKLTSLHHAYLNQEYNTALKHGSLRSAYLFSIIGLIILVIVCINFVNTTIAQAPMRTKEIFIRKMAGANKKQLQIKFLIESWLITVLAFIIAFGIAKSISAMTGHSSDFSFLLNFPNMTQILIILVIGSLFISLMAGTYPAFYLSSILPIQKLIHKRQSVASKFSVREFLIVFQFAFSIILIVSSIVIFRQYHFVTNYNLGFDQNNVVSFSISPEINQNKRAFVNELQASPYIRKVAFGNKDLFNGYHDSPTTFNYKGNQINIYTSGLAVDTNFVETMGLKLKTGASFSGLRKDTSLIIMNETAVRKLGIDGNFAEASIIDTMHNCTWRTIGVVEDFNYRSLHNPIGPYIFYFANDDFRIAYVKLNAANSSQLNEAKNSLASVWNKFSPESPLELKFMDQTVESLYRTEDNYRRLFSYFSMFAIIVSCLGLFGMVVLSSEKRIKEIGIRKINGAQVSEVMAMLNRDFVKWVAIAFVIATPIAWYTMNKWLESFAYKTELSWWIFALAGMLALGIALLTVSWQSWKAATRNPVEALRYE